MGAGAFYYTQEALRACAAQYVTRSAPCRLQVPTVRPLPPAPPASSGNSYNIPSTSVPTNQSQNVTVVVENPMTVDDKGKLVSNVVVGVTTGGKK
nr:unnamed protein product [Digitaria exilis]